MKKALLISGLMALLASPNLAAAYDIYGGSEGSQTVYHCGFLPSNARLYTTSPATVRVIERKLTGLGYFHGVDDGVFGKKEKLAVKRFQADHGLKADGVVGPLTAQLLAYQGHPGLNVHRCYGMASIR